MVAVASEESLAGSRLQKELPVGAKKSRKKLCESLAATPAHPSTSISRRESTDSACLQGLSWVSYSGSLLVPA